MTSPTDLPVPDEGPGPDDDPRPADRAAIPRNRKILLILIGVALFAWVADIVSKVIVVANLTEGDPVQIIGDTVTLKLVRNSGAAFSMGTGYTWVLTLVALAVVIGIIKFSRRLRSIWWAIGLGLVLGGALGNLTDRMVRAPGPLRGHVVDFISVGWWPVFNLADSAVVCGAVGLVVLTLFGFEMDGTRLRDEPDGDADSRPEDSDA
ncbi:signal peptidase II [Jongsikchunia kroppenstedtii]|uniref:signal peptidase II n=1 Tax=Jongsikchunia kroppenstedtii TaxID=1121721 RepID=UPI0003A26BD4|nr:signal peptidase II [Jongsikchunia kroppenstedtii]